MKEVFQLILEHHNSQWETRWKMEGRALAPSMGWRLSPMYPMWAAAVDG